MTNVEELMRAEAEFAEGAPEILRRYSPELIETLDAAMGLYKTFGKAWGESSASSDDIAEYNECGQKLGAANADELERICSGPLQDPREAVVRERLKAVEARLEARSVRRVVYLQVAVAFSRSVADLLRMRLTDAVGKQRLVVEGYALLCLMRDDPGVAKAWRDVLTDEDGKAFFGRHKRVVSQALEQAGLKEMYDRASGVSQHVRFAGAVFGLKLESRRQLDNVISDTRLLFAELREDTVAYFIAEVLNILRTQARVFTRLTWAVPEMTDAVWIERVRDFVSAVERLYARFRSAFPDDVARLESKFGPLPAVAADRAGVRPKRIVRAISEMPPQVVRELLSRFRRGLGPRR